tara:strand:+ start:481 stop:1080 length:600 start_codon:yes stop_codon:yes gene_type:complete
MSEELPQAGDPPADPPPSTEPAKQSRGARRIGQLTADLAAAHERIKLLEADSVTLERDQLAEARTQLQAKLERMKADHAAAADQWRTSEAMLRRGLTDDEGQAVALALHARLPADDRPTLADWMDSFKGEEADNTPAALRPYLQSSAPPTPAPAASLHGRQPASSPGPLGSIPSSVRTAAARGDKEAQEAIRAYLAGKR